MPAFKLPRFRRKPDRPSFLARARALKATTAKILHLPVRPRPEQPYATSDTRLGLAEGGPAVDAALVEADIEHADLLAKVDDTGTKDRSDEQLDALMNSMGVIEETLVSTRARSIAGMQAKARVFRRLTAGGGRGEEGDDIDRMAWSIARDVEALPATPAATPTHAEELDADLLALCGQFHALWDHANEGGLSDTEHDARAAAASKVEAAILATEPQSLAGLAAQARVIAATSIDENAKLLAEHVGLLAAGTIPRAHYAADVERTTVQAEDPDAALLELGRQHQDVLVQMHAARNEEECDRLCETRLMPLEAAIQAAEPSTLAGLAVQARTFADLGGAKVVHADTSSTVAKSVLRISQRTRSPSPSPFLDADAELLRLNAEYETWDGVYHAACDAQEAVERANRQEGDRAEIAVRQAVRRTKEIAIRASSIAPKTPLGFGLRARLVAAQLADWWDSDAELDPGEIACRTFLDQIIDRAGLAHIPRRDASPDEILAYTRPEKA